MTRSGVVAILVAAFVYFALGALWYSPLLFVDPWLRLIGKSFAEVKAHGAAPYPWAFLFALLTATGLAQVLRWQGSSGAGTGAFIGFALGATLSFATMAPAYLFEGRPLLLLLINGGYPLVGMCVMGLVLGAWPRTRRDDR